MSEGSLAIELRVNGESRKVKVEPRDTLLDVIRDKLDLTGTKRGCDEAVCGTCAVLFDQEPVCSCMMFALEATGHEIVTIEAIAAGENLSTVQARFVEHDAMQCGFCTSGQIVVAKSFIERHVLDHAVPDNQLEAEIKEAMAGNLCRCGCYNGIVDAIKAALGRNNR